MIDTWLTLAALRTRVQAIVHHTRPTLDVSTGSTTELDSAINFGIRKIVRAVRAVRPQFMSSYVDPFTLVAGIDEYDVSLYDPPMLRVHRLLVTGGGGATRVVKFRYRALASFDFQQAEVSRTGTFAELMYDILEGMLPGATTTVTAVPGVDQATVTDVTPFPQGTLVSIPGAGENVVLPGGGMVPGTYIGMVQAVGGLTLTLAPMPFALVIGAVITVMRRRVLKIEPAMSQGITGRLDYVYDHVRLSAAGQLVDPVIARFDDAIVFYAVSQLLQAVDDAQAQRYFEQAQEMRSEAMQDAEPLSGQASEALDSDLWGVE